MTPHPSPEFLCAFIIYKYKNILHDVFLKAYCAKMVLQVKLKQGLKTAMSISSEGNAYLQVLFPCED